MPVDGGEAEIVTDFELGVSSFSWSPDGASVLLSVAEYVDGREDEKERARAPRMIEHPAFRFDNAGWTHDKRTHLWILDVDAREASQLTTGDWSESGATWSPDGSTIAFLSSRADDRWVNPLGNVYTMSASGDLQPGHQQQLTRLRQTLGIPVDQYKELISHFSAPLGALC